MRVQTDPTSPWGTRVWIPDGDFDITMDGVRGKVRNAFAHGRGVDVDQILLESYSVTPDFGDVDSECLGRTSFEVDGSYTVRISRALADEATHSVIARRRLRSTLAHECAHIVFHSRLHTVHAGPSLFDDPPQAKAVMCRKKAIEASPGERPPWWEYQANRGMASLLLPRDLVKEHLSAALEKRGLPDIREALNLSKAKLVVEELVAVFDVSFEMTLYRLQDLGFISKHVGQSGLTI